MNKTNLSGTVIIPSYAFHLQGENTRRWCNGMFSNNFRAMQPLEAHRSAVCDDRGRIQGLMDSICVESEHFIGYLEGRSEEWFTKRFQMYMILDDIEVELLSEQILHIFGESADNGLAQLGLPIPDKGSALLHDGIWVVHRSRLNELAGYDLLFTENTAQSINEANQKLSLELFNEDRWEQIRISTGTPKFPTDFTDKSFIHDYNLQDQVCSFNKGCYVGQEIINRMDIKKLANKRLLRVQVQGDAWRVGDVLTLSNKTVGSITSIGNTIDGHRIALSILKKSAWEIGTLLMGEHGEGSVIG